MDKISNTEIDNVKDLQQKNQQYIEELQAANEELNSMNEELFTLNDELVASNEQLSELSLLATHNNQIAIITDKDQQILWVNKSFTAITEYTLEEVRGRKPNFLQGKDTELSHIQAIREGISTAKPFSQEILNYSKSGKSYWLLISITPIFDPQGELSRFIAIEMDITKQKEMINQLLYHNSSLKQFSYIVSHNLRSNVANVMGLLSLLELDKIQDAESREYLKMMNTEIQHLDNTIRDLNEVLMLKNDVMEKMSVFLWKDLMEEILVDFQLQIKEFDIQITIDLESKTVKGIKSYLRSMLHNLINNAIKYRNPKKRLHISITTNYFFPYTLLEIADNGIGIDVEANKNYIFGMYKQINPEIEGKGIGLFITRAQIEAMGGSIEVEGQKGIGCLFRVYLLAN